MFRPAAVIVLAAGQERMKSASSRRLRASPRWPVHDRTRSARCSRPRPEHLVAVVRHQREVVAAAKSRGASPAANIADQDEIPGTGRRPVRPRGFRRRSRPAPGTIVVTTAMFLCRRTPGRAGRHP